MTLPNQLSILRIALIPVFVLLLVHDTPIYALLVFLIIGISDKLDGYIARAWRQETTLGAALDAIADKLLMVTTFVTLMILEALPFPLTILLISRDVTLSLVFGIVLFTTGRRLGASTSLGQASIFAQMCTVVLGLVFYVLGDQALLQTLQSFLLPPVFTITAILAVVSWVDYLYRVVRLFTPVEASMKRQTPVR